MTEAKKKTEAAPAYSVRITPGEGLTGFQKFTEFHNGYGILDRYSVATERPDMCRQGSLEWREGFGPFLLDDIAKYWKEKGAKIEKISEAEAMKLRDKLQKDPAGHLPKPKKEKATKTKEKAKASSGEKPSGPIPPHKRER